MKKLTLDVLKERTSAQINDELLASIYGGNGSSDTENPFGSGSTDNSGGG